MKITRSEPYSSTYDVYGDPDRLVEFRLFSLNKCEMSCKGCFYRRSSNNFTDFKKALTLAQSLKKNGYTLESCFLLPTDIFDNVDNYRHFDDSDFVDLLYLFNYVGVASTLETGFKESFFEKVFSIREGLAVELQLNLSVKRLFEITYEETIKANIRKLKTLYGDKVVINLALNTGFDLKPEEIDRLKTLIMSLSEDGILELNFTFLFNEDISATKKVEMIKNSLSTVRVFSNFYKEDGSFVKEFNDRTFNSKPAFVFMGEEGSVYTLPILPFDEHVFVKDSGLLLKEPSYDGFLETFNYSSTINIPVLDKCNDCALMETCLSKHYFTLSNSYNLGCFLNY